MKPNASAAPSTLAATRSGAPPRGGSEHRLRPSARRSVSPPQSTSKLEALSPAEKGGPLTRAITRLTASLAATHDLTRYRIGCQ